MSNRLTPHEQERAKAVRAALAHAAPERLDVEAVKHEIVETFRILRQYEGGNMVDSVEAERSILARLAYLSQPDATEEAGLLEQSHRLARGMFGPHKHPGCALCATEEAIR